MKPVNPEALKMSGRSNVSAQGQEPSVNHLRLARCGRGAKKDVYERLTVTTVNRFLNARGSGNKARALRPRSNRPGWSSASSLASWSEGRAPTGSTRRIVAGANGDACIKKKGAERLYGAIQSRGGAAVWRSFAKPCRLPEHAGT
jgi:hypothetical protein